MDERTPMIDVLRRGLRRVGHSGMALKGTRDTVLVVFHPPYSDMETNSFLTIHGIRRGAWRIGMHDADPAPEPPRRNTLAAFVLAPDDEEPRFFLVPWVEYQLMVFWLFRFRSAAEGVTGPGAGVVSLR